jgi:uncharacterized surface protein with fasciclin (FAS1) repeats
MKSLILPLLALAGLLLSAPGSLFAQTVPNAPIATSLAAQSTTNTLVKALLSADLIISLKEEGDFLLLAPTDAAFARLPDGVVEVFLQPARRLSSGSYCSFT